MRMTKQNLQNIRAVFQEKTGVDLNCERRNSAIPARKVWLLAAAILCCTALAAFGWPLFSSLDGDELSLSGAYEGNGIVTVHVINHSDKYLRFQEQTKLMRWVTGEEVRPLGRSPIFENTDFAPHSEGTMTIDLSGAYDISALEQSQTNDQWFYLLLTNNSFLFGQDWMCSIRFVPARPESTEAKPDPDTFPVEAEILQNIEESLQFYFEKSYNDELMAFNEANFQYQQKVGEILTRFPGTVIPSLSPMLMVGGPSQLLDPEPVISRIPDGILLDASIPADKQYLLTGSDWSHTDACGRMVATVNEKAMTQTVYLPQHPEDTDGGAAMPLIFLFVFDAEQAQPGNFAFLYGQIYSFEELEVFRVLTDEHYAVYDVTDLIYTDLDRYLDCYLSGREDLYCDEQIRQRVHNVYDYFRSPETIPFLWEYLQTP